MWYLVPAALADYKGIKQGGAIIAKIGQFYSVLAATENNVVTGNNVFPFLRVGNRKLMETMKFGEFVITTDMPLVLISPLF